MVAIAPVRSAPTKHDAASTLGWALRTCGEGLVLACSFSLEDAVVCDLWSHLGRPRLFAIDTGRLPEETFQAAEALSQRYGVAIEWYLPEAAAVEKLVRSKGAYSFRDSLEARRECCAIRKVEPLRRALAGRAGWLTGLRREQSVTRAGLEPVEWDLEHGLWKISPLANWSRDQVWSYAREHRVPIHPLHLQGYPSIGCAPCTRAVSPGEPERAGRWWWESHEHKECGLHTRPGGR